MIKMCTFKAQAEKTLMTSLQLQWRAQSNFFTMIPKKTKHTICLSSITKAWVYSVVLKCFLLIIFLFATDPALSHNYLNSLREAVRQHSSVSQCLPLVFVHPSEPLTRPAGGYDPVADGESWSGQWSNGVGPVHCAGWRWAPRCSSAAPAVARSPSAGPAACRHRTHLPPELHLREGRMLPANQEVVSGLSMCRNTTKGTWIKRKSRYSPTLTAV